MNGALVLALVASALVGVSTASPQILAAVTAPCRTDLAGRIPEITEECGKCDCADTSACQTDQAAVMCVLEEMELWENGALNAQGALEASALTGIPITSPPTLASLTAEAKMINEKGCELVNWCAAVQANPQCALGPLINQVFAANDKMCEGWRSDALPSICTVQTTIGASAEIAKGLNTNIAGLIKAGNAMGVDCMTVQDYLGAAEEAATAEAALITGEGDGSLAADSVAAKVRACLLGTAAKLNAGC